MELIFLGTSCMQPTKQRNHPGVLLLYKGEGILFDCGEGTQRQLRCAGVKPPIITKILLSHWHGDHVLGLPGLMQTLGASGYSGTLHIYGPKGTTKNVDILRKLFAGKDTIDYVAHDVVSGEIVKTDDYIICAEQLKHTIPCIGFAFVETEKRKIIMAKIKQLKIPDGPLIGKLQRGEKISHLGKTIHPDDVSSVTQGRRIAYATDTRPCSNVVKLGKHADVLILESTYASDLADKAQEHSHMTAKEAAQLANDAQAKKLYLVHFSPRYKNAQVLEEDARDVFDNTEAAEDLMHVKL
ncbi:MAG TPA: ribonuclease Z [Candidatus Nanoarchaeia archaeon]|nr:ribonuclease Z [Candidatus Nanoarchaeia archaeon]